MGRAGEILLKDDLCALAWMLNRRNAEPAAASFQDPTRDARLK